MNTTYRTKMLSAYQNHMSDLISEQAEKYSSVSAAAKKLDLKRTTLRDWQSQRRIAPWRSYFDFRLRRSMVINTQQVEQQLAGLHRFLITSFEEFKSKSLLDTPGLAEYLTMPRTTISGWYAGRLPRPEETLHAIEMVYEKVDGLEQCIAIIKEPERFQTHEWADLVCLLDKLPSSTRASVIPHVGIAALRNYTPGNVDDAAMTLREVLLQVKSLTEYFLQEGQPARDQLRALCGSDRGELVVACVHASHLLQDERVYEDTFLKLNPGIRKKANR